MATGRVPTTANSPLTTKGDLFTYDTSQARLAVGSNGETLVADSSTSTGLRWTGTPSASNPILNSAFQIWQRGTSNVTSAYAYTADRWLKNVATHYGVSRQTTSDTTNLPFIQYCARVQRTAASTSTTVMELAQCLETVNSIPFAGKTVTLSFYARAGANYSPTSSALSAVLYTSTSTDGNVLVGPWAGAATPINSAATLTTTWQRFSFSGTIASTATQIAPFFSATPTGTAGANDYFEVTGVQIDLGSVALPFRTYAATIQGELAACQRYFVNFIPSTADYGTIISMFQATSTTAAKGGVQFPVPMRTSASLVFSTAGNFTLANSAFTPIGVSSITYAIANSTSCRIDMSVASGLVAGNATALSGNNANLLAQASAEL